MNARLKTSAALVALLLVAAGTGRAVAASTPKVADLAAQRKVAAPGKLVTGTATAKWSFRVANVGTAASKAPSAAVYLSKDAALGRGDVQLGKVAVKAVAARGSRTATVRLTVPAKTAAGKYRLIACVLPAARQAQVTKRNDCVAAATTTAVSKPVVTPAPAPTSTPPAPPAAPTLTSISEGGRGATLHPSAHGGPAPVGASVAAYDSATCDGAVLGTATVGADGAFDIAYTSDLSWGQSITMAVRVTDANGTSACSNALTYTHRGVTYTWMGTGWTGPTTIPVDSLVHIVNAPDAIVHFTDWPGAPGGTSPPHGNTSTPGAMYAMGTLSAGHYAWYNHTSSTAHTGSFTAVA
jgi:hypothetical protein